LGSTVVTDARGLYSAENLPPGKYQVRVSAVSFVTAWRENVNLRAGSRVIVDVTLATIAEALAMPARRSASSKPDDWHWTLRSPANRPVLRVAAAKDDAGDESTLQPASAPGEKPDGRGLKARVAFIAGSQAEGFGGSGDVTTAFFLEKSLFSSGT